MINRRKLLGFACAAALGFCLPGRPTLAQDTGSQNSGAQRQKAVEYSFDNQSPAFEAGAGPRINIHRYVSPYVQRGAFKPFMTLVKTDGVQASWLDKQVTPEILAETDLLVIANAYTKGGGRDYRNFSTLEAPSVYTEEEIALIVNWVRDGGALWIMADHSPFAGGTIKLAEALGFVFMTGHAIHQNSLSENIITNIDFKREGEDLRIGRLHSHPIVEGRLGRERISHFYTFGGQAIIPPAEAHSLLTIPAGYVTLLGFVPARELYSAPKIDASGLSQGAILELGKGRIAIFGETGAFTAQSIDGADPFGMIAPEADQNAEFALSTLRWLLKYQPN